MSKNLILLAFCVFRYLATIAQDTTAYEIATDRPSVSFSVATAPKNTLIVEAGYLQSNQQEEGLFKLATYTPNISLRYGISKRLEARLGGEYVASRFTDRTLNETSSSSDFLPITLGAKYRINNPEEGKWALSALWASRVPVPTKLDIIAQRHYGRFLGQYNMGKSYAFSNVGLDFIKIGQNSDAFFAYTLGVGRNFAEGLYAFVEIFGFEPFGTGLNSQGLDVGIIYIINKRYQIDAVFGVDLKTPIKNYHFFTIGFSTYFR